MEGLKVKDFGGHDVMFVRVPRSSSDKSFNNTKSWVGEALKYNGSTHGRTFESAFRISNHLCRFYRDSFVAAMEKQGMPIAQPMSMVQYAAMMSTLNITGKKEKVLGKYMRQPLGPAFCPTLRSLPPMSRFLLPPRFRQPRAVALPPPPPPFVGWLLRCCPLSDFVIACRHATINALVAGRFRR
jgi:hypothetical protein